MGAGNSVKYRLEMNEEQARVTVAALDLALRIRLGQFREIIEQCMEQLGLRQFLEYIGEHLHKDFFAEQMSLF